MKHRQPGRLEPRRDGVGGDREPRRARLLRRRQERRIGLRDPQHERDLLADDAFGERPDGIEVAHRLLELRERPRAAALLDGAPARRDQPIKRRHRRSARGRMAGGAKWDRFSGWSVATGKGGINGPSVSQTPSRSSSAESRRQ